MNIDINDKKINLEINSPSIIIETEDKKNEINIEPSVVPTIEVLGSSLSLDGKLPVAYQRNHRELENLDYENSGHTGFQPAGDYALKSDIPDTDEFATKDEVPKKLSELENDSNFVDKEYVDNEIKNIEITGVDLSNYYDKEEIDAKFEEIPETDLSNYYNKEEVDNKFNNIDIPDVDLSDYYNKSEIDEKFENIDIPDVDLSDYYTKQEIDVVVEEVGQTLSNYYNKDEINGLANELIGMVPEIVPLEEYNPEEQYADNQVANANTFNYLVGQVGEAFDEIGQYIEEVRQEAQENIFTVNYTLNPQNMSITYVSHYSADIIQKYNEGKKVTFRGYVQGLNVYVNSELQLVDGQYVFTYPLLKVNLGAGEKNYFFKIQISSNSTSVEMNEIGEGSGTDDTIFLVEYNINLSVPQVTYVSKTQQEIVNAYNDGKKVMFRGTVTGSSTILVSELNSVDSGLPYSYPFMRTDLGEGIYNYFFRISVYREFGNIEAYALVDMNRLKQTEANFQNSLSNLAMSRPDSGTVVNIVNFYVNEAMRGIQNRLLPENADEGTILKYVDGSWTAVEDDTFTVEYQLNPQTMTITEISNYSADIIEAYNNGKTINFRCYVLGLGVYVSSDLNLIEGTTAYTMPIVRGDLGQGMMNYLFRVGVRASSTFVEVRVLQEVTNNVVEEFTIEQIEKLNISDLEEKTVKEVEK